MNKNNLNCSQSREPKEKSFVSDHHDICTELNSAIDN
jgi:hypothetical protein